jgi:hypothetical protein
LIAVQFEGQFRVKDVKAFNVQEGTAKRQKPKKISVLESNRARNCGMLSWFVMACRSLSEISCFILNCYSIIPLFSKHGLSAVITTRRVGMDYLSLRDTVESSDLTMLTAEHAELLLSYVPSTEEAVALDKHTHHPDRLAEAERFMLETLSLERFETKLRVMAYIGYFDELVHSIGPQIDSVLAASEALTSSEPFKKVRGAPRYADKCVC